LTETQYENSYLVGFQFELLDDDTVYQGSTTITTQTPLNEDNPDHFTEIAKVIYRAINDEHNDNVCKKVVITSIAEDSEEVRAIKQILDGSSLVKNTDDIII